jgi:hypothetical protein
VVRGGGGGFGCNLPFYEKLGLFKTKMIDHFLCFDKGRGV